MSAATISDLFELRCAVREHMLDWLRREMPDALLHATGAPDARRAGLVVVEVDRRWRVLVLARGRDHAFADEADRARPPSRAS